MLHFNVTLNKLTFLALFSSWFWHSMPSTTKNIFGSQKYKFVYLTERKKMEPTLFENINLNSKN